MKKAKSLITVILIFTSLFALTAAGDVLYAEEEPALIHTCYFYSPNGELIAGIEVADGLTLPPLRAPELEGKRFVHWYKVDSLFLEGESIYDYDFNLPVTESLYLMALYGPLLESEELAAEESAAAEPDAEESASEEPTMDEPISEEPDSEKPASEEPAAEEPTEENPLTEEERYILLKEEIDSKNPNRKISFYATWGDKSVPEIGDEVTFHVVLSGYEGLNYLIRWQVKQSAPEDWCDLDVTGESYKLKISLQNLDWLFRVAVDIAESE